MVNSWSQKMELKIKYKHFFITELWSFDDSFSQSADSQNINTIPGFHIFPLSLKRF